MRRALLLLPLICSCDLSADEALDRRKPTVDAAVVEPPPSGDGTQAGIIACYSQGAPERTCALPVSCCFDNYSAQHNGYCSSDRCAWGTLACDGPEDCQSGLRCCATARRDELLGTTGYDVSCKASCDGPPLDHELCHSDSTCATGTCVTAYGNANDLPRALDVCR